MMRGHMDCPMMQEASAAAKREAAPARPCCPELQALHDALRSLAMRSITLALATLALAVAGCNEPETRAPDEGTTKPAAAEADLPELPAPEDHDKEPSPAEKPKVKETTATEASALGTLSEGVGLAVGSELPDITVTNIDGESVELSSLHADGPALFLFYRGGWCPYCNFQVKSMTEAYPELEERGVALAMISVDRPDESAKTSATYEIPFPVLSDSDLTAHKAFNVAFEVDDETVAKYESIGIDLEKSSGKDHHTVAVPSMFLVGEDGEVLWAHADLDYKTRPTPDQVLAAVDEAL